MKSVTDYFHAKKIKKVYLKLKKKLKLTKTHGGNLTRRTSGNISTRGSQVESLGKGIPWGTTKPGEDQNFQFGHLKCSSDMTDIGHA